MKKASNRGRINKKGDCEHCIDHNCCLAEIDTPQYYCTKNETQNKENNNETYSSIQR